MIKTGLTLVLIFSFFSLQLNPVFAQSNQTKEEKKVLKVKEKIRNLGVGEKVKIKVKLYNKTTYQGYVGQSNEDSFVVVDTAGNSTTIKYSDVDSVGGKNLSTGAKIGIGIGIGAGATVGILFIILYAITRNN
jgi:hypothetical protein